MKQKPFSPRETYLANKNLLRIYKSLLKQFNEINTFQIYETNRTFNLNLKEVKCSFNANENGLLELNAKMTIRKVKENRSR